MLHLISTLFRKKKSEPLKKKTGPVSDLSELIQRGYSAYEAGNLAEAEVLFQKVVTLDSENFDALYFLGLIFKQQGNLKDAITLLEYVVRIKNDEPEFYKTLGLCLVDANKYKEAIYAYECASRLDPHCIYTLCDLAALYKESGDFKKSLEYSQSALNTDSNCWQALNNRGDILMNCGKAEPAIQDFTKSLELNPNQADTFKNYLFALNLSTNKSPAEIFAIHKQYDEIYGKGIYGETQVKISDANPARKLRIGYVSPDFFNHAVSIFILPILANHDRANFEIFCYHNNDLRDHVTEQLKLASDHWRDCYNLSGNETLDAIRNDKIDILVDLAGHTTNASLDVFAARAAPIQITWLGYINTTGLSAMDYRIVDPYSDPPGVSEKYHSETLLRLPHTQWCFNRPSQEIQVSELPALSGNITFGSFNRYSKLSEKILTLWAKLLNKIADSKLIIMDVPDIEVDYIVSFFISLGINTKRIELNGRIPVWGFREMHNRVDIALDSHPYSGGTTTCESLWMGVPTLTLSGETSISRSTSSILQTVGLSDWIAYSEEEFIEIAQLKLRDLDGLAKLRLSLRDRLETSPVMNAPKFTQDLESAFREVWIKKCSEAKSLTDSY